MSETTQDKLPIERATEAVVNDLNDAITHEYKAYGLSMTEREYRAVLAGYFERKQMRDWCEDLRIPVPAADQERGSAAVSIILWLATLALAITLSVAAAIPQGGGLPTWFTTGGQYIHITATTATTVKATSGILVRVNVNTPAAGTLSIFDLATAACTGTPATNIVAVITMTATAPLTTFQLDAQMQNGICIKASVATDVTAVYQ